MTMASASKLHSLACTSPERMALGKQENTGDNCRWYTNQFEELARRLPMLKKMAENVRQIPPRYKCACFVLWIIWKVIATVIILSFLHHQHAKVQGAVFGAKSAAAVGDLPASPPVSVLYIVTSLAEYNNGKRNTVAGQDRLGEVVLPILVDSVESMVFHQSQHFEVDVYLILAYKLTPEREKEIRKALPEGVGLEIWDEACPLGYDKRSKNPEAILDNTRALARQHRYVIKDKLPFYDVFVAFEDDMRITAAHVQHYLHMSAEIELLEASNKVDNQNFFGGMTSRQLDHLVPGFVRVEVLLDGSEAQKDLDPIPLDYGIGNEEFHFDARPCCHVQMQPNNGTPVHPDSMDVVIWETAVKALSIRQLPNDKWVTLLPGPGKRLTVDDTIDSFWSGKLTDKWDTKPSPGQPDLIAQQGGWMATKRQLLRWNQQGGSDDHPQLCQGTFLPPFDDPVYRRDGQESMNVEFWSGGYQLFTGVKGGCNMMRLVSMEPETFSKHFIYHVANNKQKQLARKRMVRADHLWGQLNSVRKFAEHEKKTMIS